MTFFSFAVWVGWKLLDFPQLIRFPFDSSVLAGSHRDECIKDEDGGSVAAAECTNKSQ
jgi:hypothetical protein